VRQQSILARTFNALENRQFRTLWFGTVFSFLGMQMQIIARGYLAYDLTGSNAALGGVMLAFGIPQLLLGLVGGVAADRFEKRKVLWVSQFFIASNSAWIAFMIAFGLIEYWMLLVAGAVQGAGFAFVGPARAAYIGDLVRREQMGNAIVLQQLSMNGTRVIGPGLAGLLIAVPFVGTAGVYFITTAGFLVAILSLLLLPSSHPRPRAVERSPIGDLVEGIRYVARRPAIAHLVLMSFAIVMIGFPYQSFLPSIAKDVYNVGSGGLGVLSSAAAIGAVVATFLVAASAGSPRQWPMHPVLAALFGGSLVVLGTLASFPPALIAMVAVGAFSAAFQSTNNSLTMTITEPQYQGRVQSIAMLSWSFFGLVAFPIGILADHIGIQETMILQGVACILMVGVLEIYARASHAAADRSPAPSPSREAGVLAGGGQ
jgi:MFS family permease